MIKKAFERTLLLFIGVICFAVQEARAQQEPVAEELQVVSFSEAGADDDDTRLKSNFEGKLATCALIKVFTPGEIVENIEPNPTKIDYRSTRGQSYFYLVWLEKSSPEHTNNSIILRIKDGKFQTVKVNFWEKAEWNKTNVKKYIPSKSKNGGGLQAGKVYHLVLRDPSPVLIDTKLPGAYAMVDSGTKSYIADQSGYITLKDLSFGDHTVNIYASDGSMRGSVQIKESDTNKLYEFDARKKTKINIRTNPTGFQIQIKDGEFTSMYDPNKEYAYKSYTVIVDFNGNVVEKQIAVDDKHTTFVINNTKTFDITPMYMGSATSAAVYENKKALVSEEDNDVVRDGYTYHITRPIGSKYKYFASGSGCKSKSRTIFVENGMSIDYQLQMNPRNKFVWPWQREYEAAPMGVAGGYVQKQMVTKGEGEKLKENGVWQDGRDKWLYGFQLGVYAQPCFSWGLGIYTGVFYEGYFSSNGSGNSDEYEDFQEHNIVVPVHALYRFPFGKKVALSVHGGLGFSYAVYGAYKAEGYDDYSDFYGEDGAPKRFNMALEGGLDFRIGPVQVGVLYSKGLTDHGVYSSYGDYKTTYNKIGINIAWVISGE